LRSSSNLEIRRPFRFFAFETVELLDLRLGLIMGSPNLDAHIGVVSARVPAHVLFAISATFHYLGPAFAVLLFASIPPRGVAWLRVATAASILVAWRAPWRSFAALPARGRRATIALGVVVAFMNASFYEAVARIPLGTAAAIEFVAPVALAAAGARSARSCAALALAIGGVYLLADVRIAGSPAGFLFAFANAGLFALYIVLGHGIASAHARLDCLAIAIAVAAVVAAPIGLRRAAVAFTDPRLLGAAFGVGLSATVIPYVCDQLAMARLPRATFAMMLCLLPAFGCAIGAAVLGQVPSGGELIGIALVIAGVALVQLKKG
jgi:inner membrane transporter RhtA